MIAATDVRYIKLGVGGCWAKSCLEQGTIRLGYISDQHEECLRGNWAPVLEHWLRDRNGKIGPATNDLRQIMDFYTLPRTALWITIHNRLIYWCFADEEVSELPDKSRIRKAWCFADEEVSEELDKSRIRKAIRGWSRNTQKGELLHVANVDGRVTKVHGYQGTICNVERNEYLIHKINGVETPEVVQAKIAFSKLFKAAGELIQGLWWHDFELLADLIFSRQGWQRVSVLGKTEKDIDLDLVSPITNKRLYVQVKSTADLKTLRKSIKAFRASGIYSEMYFVVHTADESVCRHKEDGVTILGLDKIAELAVNSGLMNWLIKKCE